MKEAGEGVREPTRSERGVAAEVVVAARAAGSTRGAGSARGAWSGRVGRRAGCAEAVGLGACLGGAALGVGEAGFRRTALGVGIDDVTGDGGAGGLAGRRLAVLLQLVDLGLEDARRATEAAGHVGELLPAKEGDEHDRDD